VRLSS